MLANVYMLSAAVHKIVLQLIFLHLTIPLHRDLQNLSNIPPKIFAEFYPVYRNWSRICYTNILHFMADKPWSSANRTDLLPQGLLFDPTSQSPTLTA